MMSLLINREILAGPISGAKRWTAAAIVALAGLVATLPASAADAETAAPATRQGLDNATCQTCHDGKKGKLEGKKADGKARDLHQIDSAKFGKSVHAQMQCVACHTEITDAKAHHSIDPRAKKPDCISCHESLWAKAKNTPQAAKIPRLKEVVDNVEEYKKSFHAKVNADDETRSNASCNDCHEVHAFNIPAKGTEAHKEWRANTPKACGTACHEDQLDEFADSIHGTQLDEGNMNAAVCSDCHTAHSVGNTSAVTFKQKVTETCGDCHDKEFQSYERTDHGKAAAKTGGDIIRCANCHGSHAIVLRTKLPDARKRVSLDNKLCITCHDSDKNFEKFAPLRAGQKPGDKNALKELRPNLDVIHRWLPNAKMHWNSVRCVDCHIAAAPELSHEILDKDHAERKCVSCHTRNTALATRLYRYQASTEQNKFGFANSVILANSYVIGATGNPLVDAIVLLALVLTILGVIGHGALRYVAAKRRRNEQ
jgi:RNase P subunit RPR2